MSAYFLTSPPAAPVCPSMSLPLKFVSSFSACLGQDRTGRAQPNYTAEAIKIASDWF